MHSRITFCLLLTVLLGSSSAAAGPESTNLIQQIDSDTLRVGAVKLERKLRQLTIPATVNLVEGPIEYVLVSAVGKLHESVFKTSAEPIHIQTAAMLLLKEPVTTNAPPQVKIFAELPDGKNVRMEDLLQNTDPKKTLKPEAWNYRGSRLVEGTFIAQRDGSIISIIADPDAMIENGRVSADDDENWRPRKVDLPALGTPVKIILQFGR